MECGRDDRVQSQLGWSAVPGEHLGRSARSVHLIVGRWYAVWAPDSQQVAFTALYRRHVLQTAKVRGGTTVENLSTFDVQVYPSDIAADGRILALTPASGAVQDLTLTVLMNWQAALAP